jgi:hypothetical protein
MRNPLPWIAKSLKTAGLGLAHILSDDFKQSGAPKAIEFLLIAFLVVVYFFGLEQLLPGGLGMIVAAAGAILLALLVMVFVDAAFSGRNAAIRAISRLGTAAFMLMAALMTSALIYQARFVSNYANERAFAAVNALTVYAAQAAAQFSVAENQYKGAATLSAQRAVTERTRGGTCGDGSHSGVNGPRNVWRDSFALQVNSDATEIGSRAADVRSLANEIKVFGAGFDPSHGPAMQATWSSLTGRLQAVTTDPRIAQLVSDMKSRLNKADRGIGTEVGSGGRAHVVACSDPDLRAAGETAIVALQAIKPPPKLADSIVGADIQSSLHRIFVLAGHPFGLTDEPVHIEEYAIFLFALFLETMFVIVKGISYSAKSIQLDQGRVIAIETLRPILEQFANAWNDDTTKHCFQLLAPYQLERTSKYIRFGIPEGAVHIRTAMEVLKSHSVVDFVENIPTTDLDERFLARLKIRHPSPDTFVHVFEMSEPKWGALVAATTERPIAAAASESIH